MDPARLQLRINPLIAAARHSVSRTLGPRGGRNTRPCEDPGNPQRTRGFPASGSVNEKTIKDAHSPVLVNYSYLYGWQPEQLS